MKSNSKVCLSKSIATLLTVSGCLTDSSWALPKGEQVRNGSASFDRVGSQLSIRAGNRAIIDYRSFDIGNGEKVRFLQPGKDSRVLNRVTDPNPSHIFGTLEANGRVVIANPYGIFFENGSVVNVGGIIAAAGSITNEDFLAGRNSFSLSGEVVNRGSISAISDVGLYGTSVTNEGVIVSRTGAVSMVAGEKVFVGETGGNIYANSSAPVPTAKAVRTKAAVQNTGTIKAPKVFLAAGDVYGLAIAQSGNITGQDITLQAGKGGTVTVSGRVDASNLAPGRKGGRIKFSGGNIVLRDATIDASGAAGGGEILVGGDFQGGGLMLRADTTLVDAGSTLTADALTSGHGGKVVVWADGTTDFAGRISARGGAAGGNGGLVETSGKAVLHASGNVDAGAPAGNAGTWLLDPHELQITNAPSSPIPEVPADSGRFTSSDAASAIAPATILAALSRPTPTNVVLQTDADGLGIRVIDAINYLGLSAATLSLIAPTGYVQIGNTISGANLNLIIQAGGDITAGPALTGPAVTVNNLYLQGANVELTGDATTLAGRATGTFSFTDPNTLTIGTVNDGNGVPVAGVRANSTTTLVADEGLTINQRVESGSGSLSLKAPTIVTAAPGADPLLQPGGVLSATDQKIILQANTLTLGATVNAGAAAASVVTLRPLTDNLPIVLGGVSVGQFSIPQATLDKITAGLVEIGGLTHSGGISVAGPVTSAPGWNSLELLTGGNPFTQGSIVTDAGGYVSLGNTGRLFARGNEVTLTAETGFLSGAAGAGFRFTDFTAATALEVGAVGAFAAGIQAKGVTITTGVTLRVNAPIDAGAGDLSLTAESITSDTNGSLTARGQKISLTAKVLTLGATVDAGVGGVFIDSLNNFPIDLVSDAAAADAGRLLVRQGTLNKLIAGQVTVGSLSNGSGITIKTAIADGDGPTAPAWNQLTLLTTGNVGVDANGALNVAKLRVEGTNINLGGDVDILAGKATGTFAFTDPGALIIRSVDGLVGVSAGGALTITATGSLLTVDAPVVTTTGHALLTAGNILINSYVHAGGLGGVTLTAPTISLNNAAAAPDNVVSAGGDILLAGAVKLLSNAFIIGSRNVTFNETIDGPGNLNGKTLDANYDILFKGLIGNASPVGDMVLEAAGKVIFSNSINANLATGAAITARSLRSTGKTEFNVINDSYPADAFVKLGDLTHPTVRTSGSQTYEKIVTLGNNTFLYSDGGITLSTIPAAQIAGGSYDLALKFTGSAIDVSDLRIESVNNFTADGPARLGFDDQPFTTEGFQSYRGPVTLADRKAGDPATLPTIKLQAGRLAIPPSRDVAFSGTLESVGEARSLWLTGPALDPRVNAYFLGNVGGDHRDGSRPPISTKDGSNFNQGNGSGPDVRLQDLLVDGPAYFGHTPAAGAPLAAAVRVNTKGVQTYAKALLDAHTTLIASDLVFTDARPTYQITSENPVLRHDLAIFKGAGVITLPTIDATAIRSFAVGGKNLDIDNVTIRTAGLTTVGAQVYYGNVLLTADASFQAGVAIPGGLPGQQNSFGWDRNLGLAFLGTINGVGGADPARPLTLKSDGTTLLHGFVGPVGLASLTTGSVTGTAPDSKVLIDVPGSTDLRPSIWITSPNGGITFGNPVVLGENTILSATGNVIFEKTIDNYTSDVSLLKSLSVKSPGVTHFKGNIGMGGRTTFDYNLDGSQNRPLQALMTDGPGSVKFGADTAPINPLYVLTNFEQDYGDAAILNTNAILVADEVIFRRTLDRDAAVPARDLTILSAAGPVKITVPPFRATTLDVAGGSATFEGAVGNGTNGPLGNVLIDTRPWKGGGAPRSTEIIIGGDIITNGSQTYRHPVFLVADSKLEITDEGNFSFLSTVESLNDASPWNLAVISDPVAHPDNRAFFYGNVGGTIREGSMGDVTFDNTIHFQQSEFLGNPNKPSGRLHNLTVGVPALLGSTDPNSTITINTRPRQSPIAEDDTQSWYKVTLRSNGIFEASNLTIAAANTIEKQTLSPVDLPPIDLALYLGAPGSNLVLPNLVPDSVRHLIVGSRQIGVDGSKHRTTGFKTTGSQVFYSSLELPADSTFDAGAAARGPFGFQGLGFLGTIDAFTAGAPYPKLVLKTQDATLLHGVVGGVKRLGSLTSDAGGATHFDMTVPVTGAATVDELARRAGVTVEDFVKIDDAVFFNVTDPRPTLTLNTAPAPATAYALSVQSGGPQNYNGSARLHQDAVLASLRAAEVTFARTVDSGRAISDLVVKTAGITGFQGDVGVTSRLLTLATDNNNAAGERVEFSAGVIQTVAGQSYGDDVLLKSTFHFDDDGRGDIRFAQHLDADQGAPALRDLTVSNLGGGTIFFDGPVGASTTFFRLGNLTISGDGQVEFNRFAAVTTSPVFPRPAYPLAFGIGDRNGYVNLFGNLAVEIPATLSVLNATAPATGNFGNPTIRTGGSQTFDRALTLSAQPGDLNPLAVLQSDSAGALGNILFKSTIGMTESALQPGLQVNTLGLTRFDGVVKVRSLETDDVDLRTAGGLTHFDMTASGADGGVNTLEFVRINDPVRFDVTDARAVIDQITVLSGGPQAYNGAATLRQDATLVSDSEALTTGIQGIAGTNDIAFNATVDSDAGVFRNLTVNTKGDTLFGDGDADLVGGARPLASLTTDAGGATKFNILGGAQSVLTTGRQTYNDAVKLVLNTVLKSAPDGGALGTSPENDITFNATVDSAAAGSEKALAVSTGGATLFGDGGADYVGGLVPLTSLTTDDDAALDWNGAVGERTVFNILGGVNSVRTTGRQTYNDAVVLQLDTVLRSTSLGDIAFKATVDSLAVGSEKALTVNTGGATLFGDGVGADYVGGLAPLASLTTDDDAALDWDGTTGERTVFNILGGANSVQTTGGQTYNDAVVLQLDTVLRSTGRGSLAFKATVDSLAAGSVKSLTVNTGGATLFGDGGADYVGGLVPLASLTTDDDAALDWNGAVGERTVFNILGGVNSVRTTGRQTYNDAVVLQLDTVLRSTSLGDIAFKATVDSLAVGSEKALTVNTGGATLFGDGVGADYVGGLAPLASLTTDDDAALDWDGTTGERTVFNILGGANSVQTTGGQTYNDAVVLQLDTVLRSTGRGSLAFKATVDSLAAGSVKSLTVNTGGATLFGDGGADYVGGLVPLASLTTDDDAALDWNGAVGERTVFNILGGVNSVRTTGRQTYNDAVVLQLDTVLRSTSLGDIAFKATVDSLAVGSEKALTVNTGGATLFGDGVGADYVGGLAPLASLTTDDDAAVANWNGTTGERTVFNVATEVGANSVRTIGGQTYNDAVVLQLDTVLRSTSLGDIAFKATVDSPAVGSEKALTVNTGGRTLFGDGVGADYVGGLVPLASLTTDDDAALDWDGRTGERTVFNILGGVNSVQTTGGQTYNDAVVLQLGTVLRSTNLGDIAFKATVDSQEEGSEKALTVITGGATLFGDGEGPDYVGKSAALASLTTDDDAVVANWNGTAGERTVFNIQTGVGEMSVRTTGAQTYNDAVLLQRDTVLLSTNLKEIAFKATVDTDASATGFQSLTVNTLGDTLFGDGLGEDLVGGLRALKSVTTDAGGATKFNIVGGTQSVLTSERQTYNDAVKLVLDTVLVSDSDGDTTAPNTMNGVPTQFDGFGNVLVAGNNITFNATLDTEVGASDPDPLNPGARVGAYRSLTVNTKGDTVFGDGLGEDFVGNLRALKSVTTDLDKERAGGATKFNIVGGTQSVLTTERQTYNDAVKLVQDTVLVSDSAPRTLEPVSTGTDGIQGVAGVNDIAFNSTVDTDAAGEFRALSIKTAGHTIFRGDVGAEKTGTTETGRLKSLTTDHATELFDTLSFPNNETARRADFDSRERVLFDVDVKNVKTTEEQTFNDRVAVASVVNFDSRDGKSIAFKSTLDGLTKGAGGVVVSTDGTTEFNRAVGSIYPIGSLETDLGGSTVLTGGKVTATGNITFGDPIDASRTDVVLRTPGVVSILDSASVKSLTIEDASNTVLGRSGKNSTIGPKIGSIVDVSLKQTYKGPVQIDGLVELKLAGATFMSTVDGKGTLTISNVGALSGIEPDVLFTGAIGKKTPLEALTVTAGILRLAEAHVNKLLKLDATRLLELTGSTYASKSGDILFNPSVRITAAHDATILRKSGNLSINAGGNFVMGAGQKLLVDKGALTISAGRATLGDVAASVSLTVNAGSVELIGRAKSGFSNNDREDLGLGIVSPTIDFRGAAVSFKAGTPNVAVFATKSATPLVRRNVAGLSFVTEDDLEDQFGKPGKDLTGSLLQPIANGERINESNQSVTTVIVDKPRVAAIEQLGSLSAALLDALRQMGIVPRYATTEELESVGLERGVFTQPVEGKWEMLPDDYKVVVTRLSEEEVQKIVYEYLALAGDNNEELVTLAGALTDQMQKYVDSQRIQGPEFLGPNLPDDPTRLRQITGVDPEVPPVDPEIPEFAEWLRQKGASDAEVKSLQDRLTKLASVLKKLPLIGLTKKEVELCTLRICGVLAPSLGKSAEEMLPLIGKTATSAAAPKETRVAHPPSEQAGPAVPFSESLPTLQPTVESPAPGDGMASPSPTEPPPTTPEALGPLPPAPSDTTPPSVEPTTPSSPPAEPAPSDPAPMAPADSGPAAIPPPLPPEIPPAPDAGGEPVVPPAAQ